MTIPSSVSDRTLAIIKPDATQRNIQDEICDYIQISGFDILDKIPCSLSREEVEWLYQEHKDKEWFKDQVNYMLSGPVVLLLLKSTFDNTAESFRKLMGPTDRTKAESHTLRAKYAVGYRENSIHGSDSQASALRETNKFFPYLRYKRESQTEDFMDPRI